MKYPLTSGVLGLFVVICVAAESAYEFLQREPDLSKFNELVKRDHLVKMILGMKSVTLFVPVNRALEEAETRFHNFDMNVPSYHLVMHLAEKKIFPAKLQSFLSSSAPLFLTSQGSERYRPIHYFVNNARITDTLELRASDGSKQLVYVIDKVLEPYFSSTGSIPDALNFLRNPNVYGIKGEVEAFASRVNTENQEYIFEQKGNHTFFIPVGYGNYEDIHNMSKVDSTVIQGHVIPNHVIFTGMMGTKAYHTIAYNEEIKVDISFHTSTDSNNGFPVLQVQSSTLQSASRLRKGVVLSRIVHADIPVNNGVVHIIESPLMITNIKFLPVTKSLAAQAKSSLFIPLWTIIAGVVSFWN